MQQFDSSPISYVDCFSCGNPHRDSDTCRRCGKLKAILDRVSSIQLSIRSHNEWCSESLGRGNSALALAYSADAERLCRVVNVWIAAGRQLDGSAPREARRLLCEQCGKHEKADGAVWCYRCQDEWTHELELSRERRGEP